MRKVSFGLIAVTAAFALAAPLANAGVSCKVIPAMCPADPPPPGGLHDTKTHSVPEPATLTLLGAGVAAVGAAIARRRKNAGK